MHRSCSRCRKDFTSKDLCREESRGMEGERKAMGLEGVLFRYYFCPACSNADIFVDVRPAAGEAPEDFVRRREGLELVVSTLHAEEGVRANLVERQAGQEVRRQPS